MVIVICAIVCCVFICGFMYWVCTNVLKQYVDCAVESVEDIKLMFDKTNKNMDSLKLEFCKVDKSNRANMELISFKIKKIVDGLNDMKTNIIDNVSTDEKEDVITYEQMMQDFYSEKSVDYVHQVGRLKKQIELIETDYENLHEKFKKLEDENRHLKLQLEVKNPNEFDGLVSQVVGMTDEETVVEG